MHFKFCTLTDYETISSTLAAAEKFTPKESIRVEGSIHLK